MQVFTKTYYEVCHTNLNGKLDDHFDSYGEAMQAMIDARNREAEAGYMPTEYIITRTTQTRVVEDDFTFINETTLVTRVYK